MRIWFAQILVQEGVRKRKGVPHDVGIGGPRMGIRHLIPRADQRGGKVHRHNLPPAERHSGLDFHRLMLGFRFFGSGAGVGVGAGGVACNGITFSGAAASMKST